MYRRTIVRLLAGIDQSGVWVIKKMELDLVSNQVIRETKKEA